LRLVEKQMNLLFSLKFGELLVETSGGWWGLGKLKNLLFPLKFGELLVETSGG
jgi:hypothetical protein